MHGGKLLKYVKKIIKLMKIWYTRFYSQHNNRFPFLKLMPKTIVKMQIDLLIVNSFTFFIIILIKAV